MSFASPIQEVQEGWSKARTWLANSPLLSTSFLTLLNLAGSQALRLATNLILTRLLVPEAFGLMALMTVFMNGLAMFSDVGVAPSVIHHKRGMDPVFLRTAWTLQILRGFFIGLATCVLAWPLAWFYDIPELLVLLPFLGLRDFLGAFKSMAVPVHDREMKQGPLLALDLTSQFIGSLSMIAIAWFFPSVWALVIGGIIWTVVSLAGGFTFLPGIRHGLCWDEECRRELVKYGKWVFLSTLFAFLASQGDRLILAKFLSMSELGLYSIAFFFAQFMSMVLSPFCAKVLMPSYARWKEKGESVMDGRLVRLRRFVLGAVLVVAFGLTALGSELISILYDSRYHDAGWMLEALALATIPFAARATLYPMLLAAGDSYGNMQLRGTEAILMVIFAIIGGVNWGLEGIIGAYLLSHTIMVPLTYIMVRRHMPLDTLTDVIHFFTAVIGGVLIHLV